MRHFSYVSPIRAQAIFEVGPESFDVRSPREVLAGALGATLYTPGTRADYAARVDELVRGGVTSAVLCLEDAVTDASLADAEVNVVTQLKALHREAPALPIMFIRVRDPRQIPMLIDELGPAAEVVAGFVLPKFSAADGPAYLDALRDVQGATDHPIYALPVLETDRVAHVESRVTELIDIRALLTEHADLTLSIRIGGTDLSGIFGLRRSHDVTLYDVAVVRSIVADIVSVMRRDRTFTVAGAVWEHFPSSERVLRPQLRRSPSEERTDLPQAERVRADLMDRHLDGLVQEVLLDKATGLLGKSVIHPLHVRPVHAMYAVTAEEHSDATRTLSLTEGGVATSAYSNKMVEGRPHARWAAETLQRARAFGVLREGRTFVDLLDAE